MPWDEFWTWIAQAVIVLLIAAAVFAGVIDLINYAAEKKRERKP